MQIDRIFRAEILNSRNCIPLCACVALRNLLTAREGNAKRGEQAALIVDLNFDPGDHAALGPAAFYRDALGENTDPFFPALELIPRNRSWGKKAVDAPFVKAEQQGSVHTHQHSRIGAKQKNTDRLVYF